MFNFHNKVRSALPKMSNEYFPQHWYNFASAWACYIWLGFCSIFVFVLFCFIKSYFGILFTEYNLNNEIRGHDFKREHGVVDGSVWGKKKERNDAFITISQKHNRWLKDKERKEWIYDHNNILKKII